MVGVINRFLNQQFDWLANLYFNTCHVATLECVTPTYFWFLKIIQDANGGTPGLSGSAVSGGTSLWRRVKTAGGSVSGGRRSGTTATVIASASLGDIRQLAAMQEVSSCPNECHMYTVSFFFFFCTDFVCNKDL